MTSVSNLSDIFLPPHMAKNNGDGTAGPLKGLTTKRGLQCPYAEQIISWPFKGLTLTLTPWRNTRTILKTDLHNRPRNTEAALFYLYLLKTFGGEAFSESHSSRRANTQKTMEQLPVHLHEEYVILHNDCWCWGWLQYTHVLLFLHPYLPSSSSTFPDP